MLSDYSDMEQEIKDTPQPKVLPRGTEVKFRIVMVNEGTSDKNGANWYMPILDIPAEPAAVEFNTFFWDLADLDKLDEKAAMRARRSFGEFASCIGLDYSRPFSWTDDLPGMEGWAILGVKKDDEYGDKNTISKFVVGK